MLQLFPCTGKKLPAVIEKHGGGQRPQDVIGIGHIHKEHANDKQRNGQDQCPGHPFFQGLVTAFTNFFQGFRFRLFNQQVIARCLQR
ncbi:hypothetical protein D9M69_558880 [compost metagenome]